MAPATCGKFQRASNSFTTMRKVSQVGLLISRGCRVVTIAKHTSRMIFDIEESDTPNKWPAVRYPHCAANTQITQAILRSTSMAFRMCVSRRSTSCLNWFYQYLHRFLTHSKVVKPLFPCEAWYNIFRPTATTGEHPDRAVCVAITSNDCAYCHHNVMTSVSKDKIRSISSGVH